MCHIVLENSAEHPKLWKIEERERWGKNFVRSRITDHFIWQTVKTSIEGGGGICGDEVGLARKFVNDLHGGIFNESLQSS